MENSKRIEIMIEELKRLNREYNHALERAEVHRDKAKQGNLSSALFYNGALNRMEETERRMTAIMKLMIEIALPEDDLGVGA